MVLLRLQSSDSIDGLEPPRWRIHMAGSWCWLSSGSLLEAVLLTVITLCGLDFSKNKCWVWEGLSQLMKKEATDLYGPVSEVTWGHPPHTTDQSKSQAKQKAKERRSKQSVAIFNPSYCLKCFSGRSLHSWPLHHINAISFENSYLSILYILSPPSPNVYSLYHSAYFLHCSLHIVMCYDHVYIFLSYA